MRCSFCQKPITKEDKLITCCNKCFDEKVAPTESYKKFRKSLDEQIILRTSRRE